MSRRLCCSKLTRTATSRTTSPSASLSVHAMRSRQSSRDLTSSPTCARAQSSTPTAVCAQRQGAGQLRGSAAAPGRCARPLRLPPGSRGRSRCADDPLRGRAAAGRHPGACRRAATATSAGCAVGLPSRAERAPRRSDRALMGATDRRLGGVFDRAATDCKPVITPASSPASVAAAAVL